MRLVLSAALALSLVTGPAFASGKKDEAKSEAASSLDIYPFAAPITYDGRVVNYVFVSVRLVGAPGVEMQPLKAKEPFLRDAMVRAAHKTSFGKPGVLTEIDEGKVKATALAEARRILGPKTFVSAEIRKQTAQRITGLPVVRKQTASR